MVRITLIREGVAERYGLTVSSLQPLHLYTFDWRGIYRLDDSNPRSWVLRAMRHDDARQWLERPVTALLAEEWLCGGA